MRSKPKVCDYLTRTHLYRTRNKPPVLSGNVWYRVVDSFAVTMMRYHTKQLKLLMPYIRNSEPAMHEPEPWANILWLGLAAPSGVLAAVRSCLFPARTPVERCVLSDNQDAGFACMFCDM
jgi:hypothetical protein